MRYVSYLTLFLLCVTVSSSVVSSSPQEQSIKKSQVPSVVLKSFTEAFPKARIKGYAREKVEDGLVYEIESVEGKTKRDVTYTAEGELISVEESVSYAKLPDVVRNIVKQEYPKASIIRCEKVTKGTVMQFEIGLKSGGQEVEIVLNPDGTIVKTEKK